MSLIADKLFFKKKRIHEWEDKALIIIQITVYCSKMDRKHIER